MGIRKSRTIESPAHFTFSVDLGSFASAKATTKLKVGCIIFYVQSVMPRPELDKDEFMANLVLTLLLKGLCNTDFESCPFCRFKT